MKLKFIVSYKLSKSPIIWFFLFSFLKNQIYCKFIECIADIFKHFKHVHIYHHLSLRKEEMERSYWIFLLADSVTIMSWTKIRAINSSFTKLARSMASLCRTAQILQALLSIYTTLVIGAKCKLTNDEVYWVASHNNPN